MRPAVAALLVVAASATTAWQVELSGRDEIPRVSAATPTPRPVPARTLVERDAYLMGTRAHLATVASSRTAGLATLEAALAVLEATEHELSTWREDSAISTLNRWPVGTPWQTDDRLCGMFADLLEWHEATGGAFDPAVGTVLAAWQVHDGGRVPSGPELEAARARSGLRLFDLNPARCTVTRRADVTLDVGAFGKGEALDRVAAALPHGSWLIDLGGQVSVNGTAPNGQPWAVDVAHPLERDRPYLRVLLPGGSLSTSGSSERDARVDGTRVGHIMDPKTGRPASFRGSVTVWHQRGLVADILSTALYVMGPEAGLAWAASRGLSVCYLIPEDGGVRMAATRGFKTLIGASGPE